MKASINEATRPYAVIRFKREYKNKSLFTVLKKEGTDVSGFLGKLPYEPYIGAKEYILIGYDLWDEEDGMEWSIHTTNPDAITAKPTGEFFQGNEKLRITSFHLSQSRRATGTYGDDAILIEASENLDILTIRFYEGLGSHASSLLKVWDYGLLEDCVA